MPEPNRDWAALTRDLKQHARDLGFDVVGVADADPFEHERAYLQQRPPNPFETKDLDARVDPERVLPGARTIVAVGMSYFTPDDAEVSGSDDAAGHPTGGLFPSASSEETATSPPAGSPVVVSLSNHERESRSDTPQTADQPRLRGTLSRYCRGRDYHSVLGERLDQLAAWLVERAPEVRTRAYVDVGAPLDRAVAQRAGLGRFGKSTNLIARGLGTWLFLGEMLTTAPLVSDEEARWNVCGSCTRCLDACPTSCLTPWQLDWTRCLGYWNQASGDVPREFRAPLGNRLFGCDDCQDVCPYNAVAPRHVKPHPEFIPPPGLGLGAEPDLLGLLAMSKTEFQARVGPTAAAWRGLTTLQRNALLALGNSVDPAALDALVDGLARLSPRLRVATAWGLGELARHVPAIAADARDALHTRLAAEPEAHVRAEIELALAAIAGTVEHRRDQQEP